MLDHLRGRAGRVAAQAAVLTAVVAGTVAYARHGQDVANARHGQDVANARHGQDVALALDGRSADLQTGAVAAVTRIEHRHVTVTRRVTPPVIRRSTADLEVGTRRVVTRGNPGVRTVTYRVLLVGGKETRRELVSENVVRAPVAKVVHVGTRPVASRRRVVTGTDDLNWEALAQCESGGNSRAVNPAGYYGLFQFSAATWRAVGGSGLPSQAPASEQLYRAKLLYKRSGASPWGCGQHLFD